MKGWLGAVILLMLMCCDIIYYYCVQALSPLATADSHKEERQMQQPLVCIGPPPLPKSQPEADAIDCDQRCRCDPRLLERATDLKRVMLAYTYR